MANVYLYFRSFISVYIYIYIYIYVSGLPPPPGNGEGTRWEGAGGRASPLSGGAGVQGFPSLPLPPCGCGWMGGWVRVGPFPPDEWDSQSGKVRNEFALGIQQ